MSGLLLVDQLAMNLKLLSQSPFSESDSINVEALMSGDIEDLPKTNLRGKPVFE